MLSSGQLKDGGTFLWFSIFISKARAEDIPPLAHDTEKYCDF